MGTPKRVAFLCAAGVSGILTGCVDLTAWEKLDEHHLTDVWVTQGKYVFVKDTVRVNAHGLLDGFPSGLDPLTDAVWSISDTSIATLETAATPSHPEPVCCARVLVRGKRAGEVIVTATARSIQGQCRGASSQRHVGCGAMTISERVTISLLVIGLQAHERNASSTPVVVDVVLGAVAGGTIGAVALARRMNRACADDACFGIPPIAVAYVGGGLLGGAVVGGFVGEIISHLRARPSR